MAVVKGIEISGDIYDIEDETARTNASEASENASEAKTSVATLSGTVADMQDSMNEIVVQNYQVSQKVGDTTTPLDTTAQTLIGATNELAGKVNDLFGGNESYELSEGIYLKKVGNTVFVDIDTNAMYFPDVGQRALNTNDEEIRLPERFRPKRNVNTFIVYNPKDTLFRLRMTTTGYFQSWSLAYDEGTLALPTGNRYTNWQATFSYQIDM